jgi:hypothetical protein
MSLALSQISAQSRPALGALAREGDVQSRTWSRLLLRRASAWRLLGGTTAVLALMLFCPLGLQSAVAAQPQEPLVTSISPDSGLDSGGTSIVVSGANFVGVRNVWFGSVAAASFTTSGSTVTAVSPPQPAGTTVSVRVQTDVGRSAMVAASQFTYVPPVPAVSPSGGTVDGGTAVTVSGSGFLGATAVSFGTTAATDVSVVSDAQITVTSPPGSGTVDVTVTTPGGTCPISPTDTFSYVPVPAVTSISPTSGPGGTQVTIIGTRFTGATFVWFGLPSPQGAAVFVVESDTEILAVAPHLLTFVPVDVTVENPFGLSPTSAADQFTYPPPPLPTVTGLSPSSGPSGTAVTVRGSGFDTVAVVHFGDVGTTRLRVVNDTQLVVTAPLGTKTVDVTVTGLLGTSAVSPADQFTYTR